ncbi:hypothetical protein CMO91_03730 [Candidatus Woesearchaeota archaeon]|nr:hypothetical protein [Candidatus Woesearchaeota archaeon]
MAAIDEFQKLLVEASKDKANERKLVRKAHLLRLKKRLDLSPELKRTYCKECFALARWQKRIRKGVLVQTCGDCGAVTRYEL